MATTGAAMVFSTLPGDRAGRSRSLASLERRKRTRNGCWFAAVGPILASSSASTSSASGTGRARNALWVRASVKIWASAAEPTLAPRAFLTSVMVASLRRNMILGYHQRNRPNYDDFHRLQ